MRGVHRRLWRLTVFLTGILAAAQLWAQPGGAPPGPPGPSGGIADLFGQGAGQPVVAVSAQFTAPAAGEPSRLFITATMAPGWHIYSITQAPGGPSKTEIHLRPSREFRLLGDFEASPPPAKKRESIYEGLVVESHYDRVTWHTPIEFAPGLDPASVKIEGYIRAQPCDPNTCRQPTDFRFTAAKGPGVELVKTTPGVELAEKRPAAAQPTPQPLSIGLLALTLSGALVGGLVLNLMPCVLPVISLKILAFVEQGGQSRPQVFALNVWYSAGLLSVFLVLASLSASASQQLAWGEQFTYTWFKVALAGLVFVMALSFLGVWEIPIPGFVGSGAAGRLQAREGPSGAFAKGVLTTILATPCIGPFLGPVFGFMIGRPPLVTYLVFLTVGLGMACPYLIIGAFPRLIRFLPKPGAWMDTFKQVMAFLLLATVVYLFTTINEKYFVPAMTLLLGLWFACWLIGRTPITTPPPRKLLAWASGIAVAALVGLFAFTVLLHELRLPWQPFTPDNLNQARAEGKTVMVDFTADWCPNCKWNLLTAIDTEQVARLVKENNVAPLLADWTDRSPMIKETLVRLLGRQSIPVLAIWPAGSRDDEVIILDGTLSESRVIEALERAGPSKTRRR